MTTSATIETRLPELTALELESIVPVSKAAQIQGVSPDTFKRRYRHLIRRLSPRRNGVKLRSAASLISPSKRKSGAGHETGAAP